MRGHGGLWIRCLPRKSQFCRCGEQVPLSHHREPKCLCLNAECNTEQPMGDIKLKNTSITPDKDFIITLLKIY